MRCSDYTPGGAIVRAATHPVGGRRWLALRRIMSRSDPTPTVFVVDDDEDVRVSIAELLRSAGLRAETFATAQEFLDRAGGDGPSCLVLDLQLPRMGGLDVQRELASSGDPMPIIFLTGHGDIP